MQIISMSKLQKQEPQGEHEKLLLKSIFIKVKFACRCFFEYQINQQVFRTRQIRVDSKKTLYECNELVQLPKRQSVSSSRRYQQLRIAVKLLSSKGLSFTVGYIDITQQLISRADSTFEVKLHQTQDIQARCTFQIIKPASLQPFKTPHQQIADPKPYYQNPNETLSSKSKNSRLEVEFQELREDYYRLKDKFSRYEEVGPTQPTQKFPFSEPKIRQYDNKRLSDSNEEVKLKNDLLQLRVKELERQVTHNNQLFNKQKDILRIFESNLKQKNQEYEELRKKNHQLSAKNQQLYKNNCILEEEKIQYLMEQLKLQKQKNNIGEYMAHMLEEVYKVIESIFKHRISNITSIAQSKETNRKEAKRQSLTSPTSPIKKLFYSTDFKKCQEAVDHCIVQDVSLSGDFSISDMNGTNGDILMKNVLKDFQPRASSMFSEQCIQSVKTYCFKIQKIVNQSVQRLFKKIMELTSYNQAYRQQLNQEKQEFQNNEESLIDYLQQLEEGLEAQLEIVKQKDEQLQRDQGIIHTLNQALMERQRRIKQLEQAYDKLEDQKNEIRAELHQNNYIYATKEQQMLKKIYELQTGFQKPQYNQPQNPPTRLNIIQRKPTVMSDNYDDQIANHLECEDLYDNEVIYESPKEKQSDLRQSIRPQNNQFRYYEDSDQANLRNTMLKNRRLSLVKKLRQQLTITENAESIDSKDQRQQEEEKVIEQEFLKVLV